MSVKSLLFLLPLVCFSCTNSARNVPEAEQVIFDTSVNDDYSKFIIIQENKSTNKKYDHLGKLIATIDFSVRDTAFEGNVRKWVNLLNPENDLANIDHGNELVISELTATLIFDYPFQAEYSFPISSNAGFTKIELIKIVSQKYHEIYVIEEQTATVKTIPQDKRIGIYNRNQTNGKFGIWGHDLSDLVLSEINIYRNERGEIVLSLGIES